MTKLSFVPSIAQNRIFDWIEFGSGNAIVKARAGSGKSTTIVQGARFIPANEDAVILAFNAPVAKEMGTKIEALGEELGRVLSNIRASTFHSLGFGAVCKKLGRRIEIKLDGAKMHKLFQRMVVEEGGLFPDPDYSEYGTLCVEMTREFRSRMLGIYGEFVVKLAELAKGVGIGAISPDIDQRWIKVIEHHCLELESTDGSEETGIALAQKLLLRSNKEALTGSLDFHDQLYLPLLWNLRLKQYDWVIIDEAQDTNDVRRELARRALKTGGRFIAVGDPNQSIYGFTGASTDAMDLIATEFNTVEFPLSVSYRCSRAAIKYAQEIVPDIEAAPNAREGLVVNIPMIEALKRLTSTDVVICRNTAPLVNLAFSLIASGRGCTILGRDIGAGLVSLIKKRNARGIEDLSTKLDQYLNRETQKLKDKGEDARAASLADRVNCITTVISNLHEKDRTIPALLRWLEKMFDDKTGVLSLCTGHKAKGKEWDRVAILRPDLMPSKWAKAGWQADQEENLQYVVRTRTRDELYITESPEVREGCRA